MHVRNKKSGILSVAQQLKNFCSSSLWTCLHHMAILKIKPKKLKIIDFLMILAWLSRFKSIFASILHVKQIQWLAAQTNSIQPWYGWWDSQGLDVVHGTFILQNFSSASPPRSFDAFSLHCDLLHWPNMPSLQHAPQLEWKHKFASLCVWKYIYNHNKSNPFSNATFAITI